MKEQELQEDSRQTIRVKNNALVSLEHVYAQLFVNPDSEIRKASYSGNIEVSEARIDREYDDIEIDLTSAIVSLVIAGMRPQSNGVHNYIMRKLLDHGLDALNMSEEDYIKYAKQLIHISNINNMNKNDNE